jgi:hypothetical protein
MREGCQSLLAARPGLVQGRTRQRLDTGLLTVRHGLVPDLAPEGMLGQPFHLLGGLQVAEQAMGKESSRSCM